MGRVKDETLFRLVHDYLKMYLPQQRRASPHTIKAYRTAMEQLFDYITKKNGIPIASLTFEMLDAEAVSSFLDWLTAEKKCCANTRNHRLACIRAFFAYASACAPENVTYSAALTKIPIQKQDKYAGVDYMDEAAVEALLKQPDTQTRKGLRDQFFMILMYDTAARIQEMLDLRICDIRPGATPTATLLGKGSKVRTVPLMPETMQHFNNYISVFHPGESIYSQETLFFVERRGQRLPMSDDTVRYFLKQYAVEAKSACPSIPDNVHPHLFRHSRAMHLYRRGMDLTLISQWLGHANLETSLIYAHADTEQKRQAIEKSMGGKVTGGVEVPKYIVDDETLLKRLYGLR